MRRKNYLFKILVSIEILIIVFLLLKIFVEKKSPEQSIVIKKEDIVFSPTKTLRYFYEPAPNSVFNFIKPYWQKTNDQSGIVHINSDTLHSKIDYNTDKGFDTFRIITVGDSHTYGLFVDTQDNYPEKLMDIIEGRCTDKKNYEVLNFGVPGYSIRYSVERFVKRGLKYNPDLVTWLLTENDFSLVEELVHKKLRENLKKNTSTNYDIIRLKDEIHKQISQMLDKKEAEKYQSDALELFRQQYKGPLLLILIKGKDFSKEITESQKQILFSYQKERPDTYIYEIPEDLADGELLLPDGHPSKKGHVFIATALFTHLTNNNLIPCSSSIR